MRTKKQILFPKHQKILEQVGENIKLARKRRKLTIIQVSERVGSGPWLRFRNIVALLGRVSYLFSSVFKLLPVVRKFDPELVMSFSSYHAALIGRLLGRGDLWEEWMRRRYKKFKAELKVAVQRPEIGIKTKLDQIKGLIVEDYILFYQILEDKLLVLKVWDCRQNADKFNISR